MWHLLYGFFGLSGTGSHYAFWSGIGSDLGEITLLGGAYAAFKVINCRNHGCLRIGFHKVVDSNGAALPSCRKHHHDDDHTKPFRFAEHPLTRHHYDAASSVDGANDARKS